MTVNQIRSGFQIHSNALSEFLSQVSQPDWEPKPEHVKLSKTLFSFNLIRQPLYTCNVLTSHTCIGIGQVFRHKKHDYRGVIVAWYAECPLDDSWVSQWGPFKDGTDQAFYQTMIDTKDRPKGLMTFAAQENLEPLTGDVAGVEHPLMQKLFTDDPPGMHAGRHMVHEHLVKEYTEDY